ncbi:MAG: TIR domain-containing protein [Chlorobi bacterium]|nr:TIR domain-containing protein [Chlorobiota bacterium]
MNKIFVSNAKDDKSNAKKLVSKLEADGIKCYTLPRDKSQGNAEKLISDSNIFILILSKHTENSKEVTEQIKIAYDNNCHIIPFKTSAVNDSMSLQYFLHSLEWVDAHEDGFNEAYEILLEIIEEITGKKARTPKAKAKSSNNSFELKKTHLFGIIAVLFAIIIYQFTFTGNSKKEQKTYSNNKITNKIEAPNPADFTNKDLNDEEKLIVGSWKMVDYEDSRIMSPEEKKITDQNIEAMKKSVLLKYNSDRTFERIGFTPKPQKGYWEYDAKKRKIFLTPENINKKEEVNILNLTDKEMTIVVTEYIQTQQGKPETVTTKITFAKQ